MAERKPQLTRGNNASAKAERPFPKEAYEYADDVNAETVRSIRERVGTDFSNAKWKTIDGFGQVIDA